MPIIHGHARKTKTTSEYSTWLTMKKRCLYPKATGYHKYGGRGITVCQSWLESFENFLNDMGIKPSPSHSLDRINNDGNYEPSNCRWATPAEQSANTRRSVSYIEKIDRLKTEIKTMCRHGHALNINAVYVRKDGSVCCLLCRRNSRLKHEETSKHR